MHIKSWKKKIGDEVNYIDLYDNEIIVGSHFGSGHTDNAGSCSIESFIDGRYQNLIAGKFGNRVLKKILLMIEKID